MDTSSSSFTEYAMKNLKENWKAGLTVSLLSIPLSISLAVAANATPLMGIITAVFAGLVAAFFGGSNYNITGPTGALSGILAAYVLLHGVGTLPWMAITVGLMILILYFLKVGRYIVYIPASVIHGFTLGVALIISLNQLSFAMGISGLESHEHFIDNVIESLKHISQIDFGVFTLFLVAFLFLVFWGKRFPTFPGAILLAPFGILLGFLSSKGLIPLELQTLYSKFGDIPSNLLAFPHWDSHIFTQGFFITSFSVAIIAILETLISAKIADGMTKTKFRKKKEILGLGFANIASGLFGGIPATAALARTALNVKSGGTHKTSAGISALSIAFISLILLPWFKFLPLAVVASMLVYIASRMIETHHFVTLFKHDRGAFFTALFVAALTVAIDPIVGILIGATMTLLFFIWKLSKAQGEILVSQGGDSFTRQLIGDNKFFKQENIGDIIIYRFAGMLTYMNSLSHTEIVEKIDKPSTVIFSLRNVFFLDVDGVSALGEIVEILESKGKKVIFTGIHSQILPFIEKSHLYQRKLSEGLVFDRTGDALKSLHA